MNKSLKLAATFLCAATLLISCKNSAPADNELSSAEKEAGWKLLFDGKTSDGWHLYNKGKINSAWKVQDGALVCTSDPNVEHGDLLSDQEFKNFDLRFDWKLQATGNSGVFINVVEKKEYPTAWTTGPEYQLLGTEHLDMDKPTKHSGCLYGFSAQLNKVDTKPADQWNTSRIVQKDGVITFYLDGIETAKEDLKATAWKEKIKETNFKNFPDFGKALSGHIALQDWTKGISFKNVKILAL